MSNISDLLKFYNSTLSDKLKKTAAPLESCFGIDGFGYSLITQKGHFFQISNQPEIAEFYFSNNFYHSNPFIRNPDSYCTSVILPSTLDQESTNKGQEIVGQKFGCSKENFLVIYKKQGRNGHLFLFSTKNKNFTSIPNFLSNLPLLDKFCFHFLSDWKADFTKLDPFTLDMASLLGKEQFRKNPLIHLFQAEAKQKQQFLYKLGLTPVFQDSKLELSAREYECLMELALGKTAKEIASSLKLSPRTVQHYIENIKNKLGCNSKSELIKLTHDLQLL